MIFLSNHSNISTYIAIESDKYHIVAKCSDCIRQGVGGFLENGQLVGIYLKNDDFYFVYGNKHLEAKPEEVTCSNRWLNKVERQFQLEIKNSIVCDIKYKPYVSSLVLTHGDDEEEFDVLLYLSNLLKDKDSIENFIQGMRTLKAYYSKK